MSNLEKAIQIATSAHKVIVKVNDLRDNSDITQLTELKANDFKRLNKYLKAYWRLQNEMKKMD